MIGAQGGEGETPSNGDPSQFEAVLNHLKQLETALKAHSHEAAQRSGKRVAALRSEISTAQSVDYRELDRDLAQMGATLSESLQEEMDAEEVKGLRSEVKKEMKIYRKRLSKEMYQLLEKSYLDRRILALHELPEFGLLCLEQV